MILILLTLKEINNFTVGETAKALAITAFYRIDSDIAGMYHLCVILTGNRLRNYSRTRGGVSNWKLKRN